MEEFSGKIACPGIVIGRLYEMKPPSEAVRCLHVEDSEAEIRRFEQARKETEADLDVLYARALKEIGPKDAELFTAHRMILNDSGANRSVISLIRTRNVNAEYAIDVVTCRYVEDFQLMNFQYMRERISDIRDVADRLISHLMKNEEELTLPDGAVFAADDLTPSYVMRLNRGKVRAIVLRKGSVISHAVILAKAMGLPTLVGVSLPYGLEGKTCIVDGVRGVLCLEPGSETLEKYEDIRGVRESESASLLSLKDATSVTKSGQSIRLCANVGSADDVMAAVDNGAEGIGLFRTEFFYLRRNTLPDESEQYSYYRAAAEIMEGKKTVIRTLDVSSDKILEQSLLFRSNPSGAGGLEFCLGHPEIFSLQLRAICRAAVCGDVRIILPMVKNAEQVCLVRELLAKACSDLEENGIPFRDVPVGVMIETPEAVASLDELAKISAFFGIGTNDLTRSLQEMQPGAGEQKIRETVMEDIRLSAEAARRRGIEVCICGEMGSDPTLVKTFAEMGINELSMIPAAILPIRKIIRGLP